VGRDRVGVVHVVINHLRLRDPVADATVEALRKGAQLAVDAGALAARVAQVDETHLILILEFSSAEDADRMAREVGGPWMRENIRPLLAGDTERSVGEVIASAEA
jgi:precorrin isomerase